MDEKYSKKNLLLEITSGDFFIKTYFRKHESKICCFEIYLSRNVFLHVK